MKSSRQVENEDRSTVRFWLATILGIAALALLMGATFGTISSLVNATPVGLALFLLFFVPLIVHFISKRKGAIGRQAVRNVYFAAGIMLVGLLAIVFTNQALDKGAVTTVSATVVHKSAGRSSYILDVAPSWRAGKRYEALYVSGNTYAAFQVGGAVSIQLHSGFFHLPWYGNVTPR